VLCVKRRCRHRCCDKLRHIGDELSTRLEKLVAGEIQQLEQVFAEQQISRECRHDQVDLFGNIYVLDLRFQHFDSVGETIAGRNFGHNLDDRFGFNEIDTPCTQLRSDEAVNTQSRAKVKDNRVACYDL